MPESNEWHVEIRHAFAVHARDERYVLERYEELIRASNDPGTRFLLDLILSDERRHHDFFEQLLAAADLGAPRQEGEPIPLPPRPDPDQIPALLEQTLRFQEIEKKDAASLKALAHDLRPTDDETLWRLLIVLMQLDTEKHLRILDYLVRRLEDLGRPHA